MTTLKYYSVIKNKIIPIVFNKYTFDNCIIVNKTSGSLLEYYKLGNYNICSVWDDEGRRRTIRIARAIASTFHGPPPTTKHTADHIDKDPNNDTIENIRWLCKSGQASNQNKPITFKTSFIIVKDCIEKTSKEWVEYLKDHKNCMGREYTEGMIRKYAIRNHHGFSYKKYTNLQGEVWKTIENSYNKHGHWEISDMNRVKYTTTQTENVLSGNDIGLISGYPQIYINGKHWLCHILAFKTFFPEEYANMKPGEMILHEDDDRIDFRPHKLRIGSRSDNGKDAHHNGKFDGKKTARMKCASYIDGVLEKEHQSMTDAVVYLKTKGFDKAGQTNINRALCEKQKTAYKRVWKCV